MCEQDAATAVLVRLAPISNNEVVSRRARKERAAARRTPIVYLEVRPILYTELNSAARSGRERRVGPAITLPALDDQSFDVAPARHEPHAIAVGCEAGDLVEGRVAIWPRPIPVDFARWGDTGKIPVIPGTRETCAGDDAAILHRGHGRHAVAQSNGNGRHLRTGARRRRPRRSPPVEQPRGRCGDGPIGKQRDAVDAELASARDPADAECRIDDCIRGESDETAWSSA